MGKFVRYLGTCKGFFSPNFAVSPILSILFLLLSISAFAQVSDAKQKIIIGTETAYPPYSYKDQNGNLAGMNISFIKAISEVTGIEVEIKMAPWNQISQELEAGQIDAICGMYYSHERDKTFDFSIKYTVAYHEIFCREATPSIRFAKDLTEHKVAVMRGDIMHEFIKDLKFYEPPLLYDDQSQALLAVNSGKAQYALVARLPGNHWKQKLGLKNLKSTGSSFLGSYACCFAVKEGNHKILSQINEGLALLKQTGRLREIENSWYGKYGMESNFEPAENKIRLGVLAKSGKEECYKKWGLTAEYLSNEIDGYDFSLVALDFNEIFTSVENKEIDFIIANSSYYAQMEVTYGISRLATLKNSHYGKPYTDFAGVIFTNLKYKNIQNFSDLKNKRFIAVDKNSFGGWQMAKYEFLEHGIIPEKDFKSLKFGGTHEDVVFSVLNEKADAGTVRSDCLERMQLEGKIKLKDLNIVKVYNCPNKENFSLIHSTRHYPEWPIAKLKHIPDELGEKVTSALLLMGHDSAAANAANCKGWTVPQNYQTVHDCLKNLKVGPYKNYGKVSIAQILAQHWPLVLIISLLVVAITFIAFYASTLNVGLKESLEKQSEQFAFINTLLSAAPSPIFYKNKDGVYLGCNEAFEDFIGLNNDEIIGQTVNDILPDKMAKKYHEKDMELIRNGGNQVYESEMVTDKGIRNVLVHKSVFTNSYGKNVGLIGVITDITKQKYIEDQLRHAKEQAEHATLAKGQFLANMSHEIRTPMNGIIGFGELLANEDLTPDQRQYVDTIQRCGLNLLTLINDILDFSKIEAGKLNIEMIETDLGLVLHDIDSLLRPLANKKNLKFEVLQCGDLPAKIKTDQVRLRQCLINLANNAIKFTESGHVYVNTSLESRDGKHWIRFDVEDTGIGIDQSKLENVFELFTQADSSTTRKFGGTGLGLSITKQLIELMGGQISVHSTIGKGSTFTIAVPVGLEIDDQNKLDRYKFLEEVNEPEKNQTGRKFDGEKVLVANFARHQDAKRENQVAFTGPLFDAVHTV